MGRSRHKFIHRLDGFCMCVFELIKFNLILLVSLVQVLNCEEGVIFES